MLFAARKLARERVGVATLQAARAEAAAESRTEPPAAQHRGAGHKPQDLDNPSINLWGAGQPDSAAPRKHLDPPASREVGEDDILRSMSSVIEESVKTLLEQGQLPDAVELILQAYGPELRGYLRGTFNDPDEGDDIFQELAIAIWRRLPDFEFRSTLRNWCYAIAHRRVAKRLARYSRRNRVRFDSEEQARLVAHLAHAQPGRGRRDHLGDRPHALRRRRDRGQRRGGVPRQRDHEALGDPAAGREVLIERTERAVGYTPIHNPAGCPAMTLPLGWDDDGLPIGVQFAAAPGQDARVLGLAYELEQAAPWADRRPGA